MFPGILLAVIAVLLILTTAYIINEYKKVFGKRFETDEDYFLYLQKFHSQWKRTPVSFPSNKGQMLSGFLFSYDLPEYKALLVVVHGMDTSMDHYMSEVEHFARQGYLVFSYDSTGTGRSGGESLIGLSQSAVDLHYALRYIESQTEFSQYPLLLYGHSWGGFAVDAVSNFGDHHIRAIISVSAFNKGSAVTYERGLRQVGRIIYLLMPALRVYTCYLFGIAAFYTGISGLSNTSAKVLMLHSSDDAVVNYENNFEQYQKRFKHDPRFTFIPLEGRGHNVVTPPDIMLEMKALYKQKKALEGQYGAGQVPDELIAPITEKMHALRAIADPALMEKFSAFYSSVLAGETYP